MFAFPDEDIQWCIPLSDFYTKPGDKSRERVLHYKKHTNTGKVSHPFQNNMFAITFNVLKTYIRWVITSNLPTKYIFWIDYLKCVIPGSFFNTSAHDVRHFCFSNFWVVGSKSKDNILVSTWRFFLLFKSLWTDIEMSLFKSRYVFRLFKKRLLAWIQ